MSLGATEGVLSSLLREARAVDGSGSGPVSPFRRPSALRSSAAPCRTTETKASFKTTEFFAFLAAVAGVLLAGLVVDDATNGGFDAKQVWLYVTILTVGYRAARVVRRVRRLGGRDPRDGALSYAAGAAAAAGAFQVLRHTAGRLVGAVIDH